MLALATVPVAVVAGGGAVAVPANAVMGVVGLCGLVRGCGVAIDTGKAGIVGRDLMAVVADRAVVGDGKVKMAEGGAEPAGCIVASVAGGGKPSGYVVRDGAAKSLGTVPVGQMAAIARGIRRGQAVVVI